MYWNSEWAVHREANSECSVQTSDMANGWQEKKNWKLLQVGIAGVEADTRMEQTKVKMDTWIPAWDHEFEFPLSVPELALLRVEVHESDNHQKDDFGGQTCLPVWELRRGIRSVRLCDHRGEPLRSVKLLMRFDFTWLLHLLLHHRHRLSSSSSMYDIMRDEALIVLFPSRNIAM